MGRTRPREENKVFLATTPLTEFWGDSPEPFFLGRRCLRHHRQQVGVP